MRLLIVLLLFIAITASAQPGTEIYLFDLKVSSKKVKLSNGKNITNRVGYDNQPSFHPDGKLMYFVSADETGNTDIYEFNLREGNTSRLTQTTDREYSPTVTPDKKFLSCILQNQKGAQYLVKYPIKGGNADTLINDKIVGYHAWADAERVLLFTLPQPFKLELVNLSDNKTTVVTEAIGRSLHKIPSSESMSFVKKISDTEYEIQSVNPKTIATSSIAKALPGKEHDMAWISDGKILMSNDKHVFFLSPGSSEWKAVEFAEPVPGNISRIAVSPDAKYIALVISE